jgi:hypothetical protein
MVRSIGVTSLCVVAWSLGCGASGTDLPLAPSTARDAAFDAEASGADTPADAAVEGGLAVDVPAQDAEPVRCQDEPPPRPDTIATKLATEYAPHYRVYDLGPVPGMPSGHLGGAILDRADPNRLILAGDSESPSGALYAVEVERGPCGHVVGFKGAARKLASTPYVDANILDLPGGTWLYSQWPANKLGLVTAGATAPSREIDLAPLGVDSSIGGLGFVPTGYAGAGGLRGLTWSAGNWFDLSLVADGSSYTVTTATRKTTLPNGPGGFAYVPAGSPGFPENRLIVSEWSANSVATYAVDDRGDPRVDTRKPFFDEFPRPWGAYFDPPTGDFLFLTWSSPPDRVFVVQGFEKPPPPPPPPR